MLITIENMKHTLCQKSLKSLVQRSKVRDRRSENREEWESRSIVWFEEVTICDMLIPLFSYLAPENKMKYLIVIETTETGYSVYSPDLEGCVATGSTREEVEKAMRKAIEFHLDGLSKKKVILSPHHTVIRLMLKSERNHAL